MDEIPNRSARSLAREKEEEEKNTEPERIDSQVRMV